MKFERHFDLEQIKNFKLFQACNWHAELGVKEETKKLFGEKIYETLIDADILIHSIKLSSDKATVSYLIPVMTDSVTLMQALMKSLIHTLIFHLIDEQAETLATLKCEVNTDKLPDWHIELNDTPNCLEFVVNYELNNISAF